MQTSLVPKPLNTAFARRASQASWTLLHCRIESSQLTPSYPFSASSFLSFCTITSPPSSFSTSSFSSAIKTWFFLFLYTTSSAFWLMESDSSNTQKKKTTTFPPQRGQVKAQIFESFANTVTSMFSKLGEVVAKIRGEGGREGNSASSTPPRSSFNSDGNSDIS